MTNCSGLVTALRRSPTITDRHQSTDHHRSDLLDVVRAAERAFDAVDDGPTDAREPARRVFETLLGGDLEPAPARARGEALPACAHLDDAVARAREHRGATAGLADAVATIARQVTWMRREEPERPTPGFADGHANAVLAHASGPEWNALMGISLMAPNVRYPDHAHPPEEVYLVLSPGEWRNERHAWFEPGIGHVVHNPAGIVHAMRSGQVPLFAVWLHLDRRGSAPPVAS
ncbi:dimethylsulfonioproprionate lyase family protein [Ilumatobacter sp.]|uniref:dimethylsulfonioproprionate lyase family protein n=1 Tax=Ilumatobacter sp. TaxID=1967498 RepID=UPI003AF7DDE7